MGKKISLAILLLLAPSLAFAGRTYDNRTHSSSTTLRVGHRGVNRSDAVLTSSGPLVVQSTYTGVGSYPPLLVEDAAGTNLLQLSSTGTLTLADKLQADITGNAEGTASALAANGTNCGIGELAQGVDAAGNAEGCTPSGAGDAVLAATQTFTGTNTFLGPVDISTWSSIVMTSPGNAETNFKGCSVSTVSITMVGSTVTISGSGSVQGNTSTQFAVAIVLMDGDYMDGETSTKGVASGSLSNGQFAALGFERTFTGITPGQHTFCIGFYASGSNTFSASTTTDYVFKVKEDILR